MPWSLWKWLGSQRIFEGIKFPNPIGYSPGQAHVTNIDPKCSFFYWAWKSENRIPIFSLVYLGCPWGCILKSTLVAPALKENIFEKVKQNTRKRMSPNTTAKERQRVCMIVLDDHGLSVPPLFFSNWPCQNVQKIIEFQKYFPISAKAMPWSLWKWLGSQRIFEGIKFPNPIGYSPGQAHVTNIDPKCSFFYWA